MGGMCGERLSFRGGGGTTQTLEVALVLTGDPFSLPFTPTPSLTSLLPLPLAIGVRCERSNDPDEGPGDARDTTPMSSRSLPWRCRGEVCSGDAVGL